MEIKTKFKVGEWIYIMHNNEIHHCEILEVIINITSGNSVRIVYRLKTRSIEEHKCFATKDALIEDLKNN